MVHLPITCLRSTCAAGAVDVAAGLKGTMNPGNVTLGAAAGGENLDN